MEYPIPECNWKHILEDDVHDLDRRVLQHVYGDLPSNVELSLDNLDDYINFQLESSVASVPKVPPCEGRLGPDHVLFDISSNVGSLVIDKDRLGVSSQSNFSSIRANCCVYRGRWQYELMLGSKGVMQVGWATVSCKFSQEKGVGDTPDSYSFDGNRVQKWNSITAKYGEPWLAGDIIGCTIDLDQGKVHFYRNGCWMGEAFNNIRLGPGLAYFPAVSLVFNENLVANFGALPFRYPVEGFLPLESVPHIEMIKAEKLLNWLDRFLPFYDVDCSNYQLIPEHHGWTRLPERGKKASMLLLVTPLMQHLGPLLMSAYISEACLLNFLFKLCHIDSREPRALPDMNAIKMNSKVQALLDIIWTLMDFSEVGQCLENLIVSLLTGYRFSIPTADFYHQRCYLLVVLVILQHERTCQYLLQNVLFDRTKFPMFMEIKPLDNGVLEEMVPVIWYESTNSMVQLSEYEQESKAAYKASFNRLSACVSQLKEIQDHILVQLFRPASSPSKPSCRSIFLSKFREFLKENSGGSRMPMVHLCPLSVALAFFHRLMVLLRQHLDVSREPQIDATNLVVPTDVFYNGTVNYCDIHRIGGLISHLQKQYQEELKEAARLIKCGVEDMDTSDQAALPFVCHSDLLLLPPGLESYRREKDDYEVMIELLDSIIKLYVISAHRQLEKMCSLRESMQEYVMALRDLDNRRAIYEEDSQLCLERTREVFLKKLAEQARHLAWACAVVYSRESREDVHWLLHITLRTLDQASSSGPFFVFVPDFYVEACIKSCNALRSFFSTALPVEDLPNWDETLVQFGSFLANNFANPRIVNADLKDSLVQAFASFVCHPSTLRALESMSFSTQQTMVKALLQPYENRAWAQSNWILVRLWKGCGFAFRYTVPPHLGNKGKHHAEDFVSNHHRPCPSPLFQRQVAHWLWENPDAASVFLSSILNQLNWAFSEFIGMLQEIQNATNRPEKVFIDSRQLKICATCFDLALALLRVLEMVIYLQPNLFTSSDRPSAEILLTRLCQLICQVLNRVTSKSGCFELVVSMDIPGLETVHHFPILAAVAGIILSLINNGPTGSRETAIKAFLIEPSFQPHSLDFLLPDKGAASTSSSAGVFSFDNFGDVSGEEKEQFRHVVNDLHQRHKRVQEEEEDSIIDEEALCTICYANPKSATFLPCAHESCRSCISLHLLHQRDCFFCKTAIDRVLSASGEIIYQTTQVSK